MDYRAVVWDRGLALSCSIVAKKDYGSERAAVAMWQCCLRCWRFFGRTACGIELAVGVSRCGLRSCRIGRKDGPSRRG
jgi:hypothetical protein